MENISDDAQTQSAGVVLIYDLKGMTWSHLFQLLSPAYFNKYVNTLHNCLPLRIIAIHYVNQPPMFSILFKALLPIFSAKIKQRVHLHGTSMVSLHKHVSPRLLPRELGGLQGKFDSKEHLRELLAWETRWLENLRPSANFDSSSPQEDSEDEEVDEEGERVRHTRQWILDPNIPLFY
jgi:hypothetical protein